MTPTVVLFDVDGTLISCGGAGRSALAATFRQLHGRDDVFDFAFDGLTDRAIVRAGLRRAGVSDDLGAIDAVIARYLELLPECVAQSAGYRVLPGVQALLQSLSGCPNLALGLGTGNVRRGAYTKLARGGLGDGFSFGGFGCDHEDRAELCTVGAARGAERLGVARADCRVVIVGDTPRDVAAARAIGAECIAVATGQSTPADLKRAGANRVVADLSDESVLESLTSC